MKENKKKVAREQLSMEMLEAVTGARIRWKDIILTDEQKKELEELERRIQNS